MSRDAKVASPSLFEVTLGAVLSVLMGGVLAAAYLVAQPVQTVKRLPKEPEDGVVYYIQGSSRSALGGQWLRKKQMFVEGGSLNIKLSEDELNTWMSKSEAKPDGEDDAGGFFVANGLNFRVNEGVFQIGLPCTLSLMGFSRDVVIQAQGGFEKEAGTHRFAPNRVMIGTLDVTRVPVVGGMIVNWLMNTQEYPEELTVAWQNLDRVAVEENALVLMAR